MNNIVFYQLDALLEIISRDRVTATPPHVSVRQQEDTGNGPVLDGGIDLGVAPNVALPDDDNVFHSTEAQSSIALDNSLEPDTIAITSEDAALWATIDKILARSRAERLASSPPANIPSECACETAVSDDCTTEDIDFEGRISVENVQADGNGSIAGHNSETLPGTPCDNSALLDSTSSLLLPLPPSSPVSAHIPRTDIPETVVDTKGKDAASIETSYSAHSPMSSPLPPPRMRSRSLSTSSSAHSPLSPPPPPSRMRSHSLSTSAADSFDAYQQDEVITQVSSSVPCRATVLSSPSASPSAYRGRSRSVSSFGTSRGGSPSSASRPALRRSSSVSAARNRDARDLVLYTPEIPQFVDNVSLGSSTIATERHNTAASLPQPKWKFVCCQAGVDPTLKSTISPAARLEWFSACYRARSNEDTVAPGDLWTIYHDHLGLCGSLTVGNCMRASGGICSHEHIPQSLAVIAPAPQRCTVHQSSESVDEVSMGDGDGNCPVGHHFDTTEDLWQAWYEWISWVNKSQEDPEALSECSSSRSLCSNHSFLLPIIQIGRKMCLHRPCPPLTADQ